MQTTDILELIQQRAGSESHEEASNAFIAVVETPVEQDLDGEHPNFAAQVSKELGEILAKGDPKNKENFDAKEFVN